MLLASWPALYSRIPLVILILVSIRVDTKPVVHSPRLLTRSKQVASAWNGRTDTSSVDDYSKKHFTPYFVPTGSISLDDYDTVIEYSPEGAWSTSRYAALVNSTMHISSTAGSRAELSFEGTGIEWFGSLSAKHGIAAVFINDTLQSKVDAYDSTWLKRQRLFGVDHLPYGTHRFAVVNTGKKSHRSRGYFIDVDAFVVNPGLAAHTAVDRRSRGLLGDLLAEPVQRQAQTNLPAGVSSVGEWTLTQAGETKVHAMQLSIISATHAIIIDKVEHNPLTIDGHPAWGALYDLRTNDVRPLNMKSNSFCAGGSFLSNGSFINVGGNPVVVDSTGAADFGDVNGMQAVRLFHPNMCDDQGKGCDIIEAPHKMRLASPRWYNTVMRLDDGSAMILGGSTRGGWMNNATTNNPTFEYFPPKNINGFNGIPIPSPFLAETLNSNLFPIAFLLPDGRVFVAANLDAMIYDWKSNTEQRLPRIPNGVRVTYPMTGTATLLPLSSSDDYTPTILICGGSNIDDTRPGYDIDSQEPASSQCVRMDLTDAGIQHGWRVEQMPQARIMPDAVLLPTGEVLIVNGGATGIGGYGNVKNQIGFSNADNPVLRPVLYRPTAPLESRFSNDGLPSSDIARLYHSVATLVPDGRVMVTGSNPNLDRSATKYATEYRVEWFAPAWMDDGSARPQMNVSTESVLYGSQFTISSALVDSEMGQVKVALMDLGFVTHSLHMNSRLVYLDYKVDDTAGSQTLRVQAPPQPGVYPPGPGWLYLVVGEKWSIGSPVMVGDGANPPEDADALSNMLSKSDASKDKPDTNASG